MKKIGKYLLVLLTMFTFVTPYASALEEDNINENKVILAEEKKVTITVKYVDNNNKTIETSTKQEVKVGNTYKVEAKEITGYVLKSESATIEDTASKDTEVTFVYHPVADLFIRIDATIQYENGTTGYPESEYLYVGTTSVTGKKVYDINANTTTDLSAILSLNDKVENEVTTKITDKEVIDYLNKTYKADLQEDDDIVWYVIKSQHTTKATKTYKDANGNSVKVEVPECLYHIDGVVYKKGKVTTNYVDEEGNKLTASKVDTYYYGETYTTTAKSFDDYELIETKGTESAKVNTRETTVTYVYQFVMGQGDDEPIPTPAPTVDPIEEPVEEEKKEEPTNLVQTGEEVDYSLMTSALITVSLMVIALKTKKKNNN